MILLKSIQLKNFLSHADTYINFEFSERLLIDGKSGAGKSAIIDALIWGLYNVGRVQNRSLIKRGKSEAQVVINLAEGPIDTLFMNSTVYNKFEIIRIISAKGLHTLTVTQNDEPIPVSGTKNIQEFIEKQILKCSYSLFINSVCYPQENLESFVRQTPSKRKDILLELVHAEDYQVYYEKIKDLASEISGKISSFESGRVRIQSDLEEMKQSATQLEKWETEVTRLNTDIQKTSDQLEDIRKQEVELSGLSERLIASKREGEELNRQLKEVGQAIDGLRAKINALRGLDETQIKLKLGRLEAVKGEIITLEGQMRALYTWKDEYMALYLKKPSEVSYDTRIGEINRQLKTLIARTIANEKCPHCGEEHLCTLIAEEIREQVNILNTELVSIGKLLNTYKEVMEKFQEELTALIDKKPKVDPDRLNTLQSEVQELEPYLSQPAILALRDENIKQFETEIGKLLAKERELSEKLILISQLVTDLESTINLNEVKTIKITLLQQAQVLQTSLWKATEQLTLAKSAVNRVTKLEGEIQKQLVEGKEWQEKLDNLLLLKTAFGVDGIKAIVVDYLLPVVEQKINDVLRTVSDFKISLNTQIENVTGDKKIEGLFIQIVNPQGETFDFDSFSGGERVRITFSIAEGLSTFSKIGWRILDEAVQALDDESGDQFAQAILAFQDKFQQLICISHVKEVKEIFEKSILVVNTNGNSRVAI